ncbi:MAG: hypothetical protein NWQ23_05575 [Yoonia sp.]|uniref:hypothetical protein n=1 Tax=Yoonia sp. TaxID=2212373 RepID=UPI00273D249D|nr:hypothetical protein [Yoonia sp.]MDP5084872.1 hypothetical protein [Yoonia sp.]MDP5361958.1 hypothetical protein [Paracoccaceae bacterium]
MPALHRTITICLAIGVAACAPLGPIEGTNDSGVNRLQLGMTPAQVEATIGAPQFEEASPSDPSIICKSYIYDEVIGAKFAHVTFSDGILIAARDNQRKTCQPD